MKNTQGDRSERHTGVPEESVVRGGVNPAVRCIDSQVILGDRDEVLIRHGDQIYRLRKTRYGKLILNK